MDFAQLDKDAYMALAEEGLAWVRKYRTTKAVVAYMLHEAGYEEPRSVLLVVRDGMDYLEFTMEHGLAELGINYTVVHERPFLRHVTYDPAKGMPSSAEMDIERTYKKRLYAFHGRGVGYGFRLPHTRQVEEAGEELDERIKAGEFDLVMTYSLPPMAQSPMRAIKSSNFPKNRVLIFDGSDNLAGGDDILGQSYVANHGMLFRRELVDGPCPGALV